MNVDFAKIVYNDI